MKGLFKLALYKIFQIGYLPEEVSKLHQESDYALDRKIWIGLARLDLVIRDTSGIYMSHVFPEITNQ